MICPHCKKPEYAEGNLFCCRGKEMTDSIKNLRPMLNERIKRIENDTKTKITGVSEKVQDDRPTGMLAKTRNIQVVSSNSSPKKGWLLYQDANKICKE